MGALLNKLFLKKLNLGRLGISALAYVLGLAIMLLSLQLYSQLRKVFAPNTGIAEYLVLSKQVNLGNTLFNAKATIDTATLKTLEQAPFVKDIGHFKTNQFSVRAYMRGNFNFSTDLFFEAVPDRFLEDPPQNWRWKPGDKEVPIVLNKEFINLYNFGYAISANLPQITSGSLGVLPLNLVVQGPKGRQQFKGRLAGVSDRIPSVLVPNEFMQWANQNIGRGPSKEVSRVIVQMDNAYKGNLKEFLSQNGLSVNQDRLKSSQTAAVLNVVMSTTGFIGLLFFVLALLIMVLNFTLMISESKQEIILLKQLGYTTPMLIKKLMRLLLPYLGTSFLLAMVTFFVVNALLAGQSLLAGLEIKSGIQAITLYAAGFFLIVSVALPFFQLRRVLNQHA